MHLFIHYPPQHFFFTFYFLYIYFWKIITKNILKNKEQENDLEFFFLSINLCFLLDMHIKYIIFSWRKNNFTFFFKIMYFFTHPREKRKYRDLLETFFFHVSSQVKTFFHVSRLTFSLCFWKKLATFFLKMSINVIKFTVFIFISCCRNKMNVI